MLIDTTRFGKVEIDDTRVITFKDGLLGFPNHRRFALLQAAEDSIFFWLQAVEDPTLAFLTCDPLAFAPDYQAQIRPDDVRTLELRELTDCQVLVILNKHDGIMTANLLGPLVIGAHSLLGKQLVLSDKRYSTRHPIARNSETNAVTKTA